MGRKRRGRKEGGLSAREAGTIERRHGEGEREKEIKRKESGSV